jgi:hypothetical protein
MNDIIRNNLMSYFTGALVMGGIILVYNFENPTPYKVVGIIFLLIGIVRLYQISFMGDKK